MSADDDAAHEAMLARAFANLGATPDQARVMSAQLLKRAHQLAIERGTTAESALAGLLAKVVAGRTGEYAPDDDARGKSG